METELNELLKKLNELFKPHKEKIGTYAFNKAREKYDRAYEIIRQEERKIIRGTLETGNTRPNYVSKYLKIKEEVFVSGLVEHSGREHEPLTLKGWYIPIPNTATKSFTITGNID